MTILIINGDETLEFERGTCRHGELLFRRVLIHGRWYERTAGHDFIANGQRVLLIGMIASEREN